MPLVACYIRFTACEFKQNCVTAVKTPQCALWGFVLFAYSISLNALICSSISVSRLGDDTL